MTYSFDLWLFEWCGRVCDFRERLVADIGFFRFAYEFPVLNWLIFNRKSWFHGEFSGKLDFFKNCMLRLSMNEVWVTSKGHMGFTSPFYVLHNPHMTPDPRFSLFKFTQDVPDSFQSSPLLKVNIKNYQWVWNRRCWVQKMDFFIDITFWSAQSQKK